MERIHHVVEGHRVFRRFLDFAVVIRCADENQGVGLVPADNGDDDVRVFLDVFPGAVAVGYLI